jgi:1,4-alpha-glucan branching enzyme
MVPYLVSHDEDRTANELRGWGFSDKQVQRKLALGATVLLTGGGEPMFYMGEEWGEGSPYSQKANPIHWECLETPEGQALFQHHKRLCQLRREHPAMRSENFRFLLLDDEAKSLAFRRWDGRGDEVVVAVNFRDIRQTLPIAFPESGAWRETLRGGITNTGADPAEIVLDPYESAVFVRA